MKIINNYHSHTIYCKHASETVEEVILQAIKHGFKEEGLSGHCPLPYGEKNNRMGTIDELESYFEECKRVREKYKKEISIKIGLEFDIINPNKPEEDMGKWLRKLESYPELDYIIAGHHTLPKTKNKKDWKIYLNKLEEFINYSSKFKYLAHPDIFMIKFEKEDELSKWISEEIINISIRYDFPLGINLNGLYEGKEYPSASFFKMAVEKGAKTIFEMDNHYAEVWDDITFERAFEFIKKVGARPVNLEE